MVKLEWTAARYEPFFYGVAIADQQVMAIVITAKYSDIFDALQSRIMGWRRRWPALGDLAATPALEHQLGRAALDVIGNYCDNPGRGEIALRHLITDDCIQQQVIATPFEKQVWTAMRDIPVGCTFSYAQLANYMGKPKAVRAVASACGHNPWAIAVPCHRVIRSDGSLGGYHWGLNIKRHLLNNEANWLAKGDSLDMNESIRRLPCQRPLELI